MEQLIKDVASVYGVERAKFVRDVLRVVRAKVMTKNMFGWRYWLDERLMSLAEYIITTEFAYSGGAYVACGMQGALDDCRYCNAKKRKADFEALSLYSLFSAEDKAPEAKEMNSVVELVIDIEANFGQDLAKKIEPFLRGEKDSLDKDVLEICRSPRFIAWFKKYMEVEDATEQEELQDNRVDARA